MDKARILQPLGMSLFITLMSASGCLADEAEEVESHQYTNALIHSTSPYLLQHAHNPVNWMPWGPEAFAKAKAENKPIFVSIGYSTCYWCHVMERESFEKEDVAKILNDNYIAIKVDREERPDIDEQLMLATQLMTGRGGWPNSIWLTTDGRPWMAGTYFPKEQFKSALLQLSTAWNTQAAGVEKQANALSDAIREASQLDIPAVPVRLDESPMTRAMAELNQIFDREHGGFGSQPKFPPHGVLRLLALAASEGDETARLMLNRNLDAMWCGGIHDHVGGGFHRYATDERWFLPHFEKMLHDNGQLMRAYSEAYAITGRSIYKAAVEDIFKWLQREMTHTQGAFFSAIDSESEGGEEGRYYTWSMSELNQVLGDADATYFADAYNFQDIGNFTEEATGNRPGTNIPFLQVSQIKLSMDERLAKLRDQMTAARKEREYPHLDDKILTSWNGLMISALARAGVVFDDQRYVDAAEKAAEFILNQLQSDGRLLRTWRGGKASLPGYLNDYAFLSEALLELHAATGNTKWLAEAERLATQMLDLFEDQANGGFFFTSREHERLLLRSKNLQGGGNLPLGNGVAAQVLLQLHEATDDSRYLTATERTLTSFSNLMRKSPRQVEHLVLANALYLKRFKDATTSEPQQVIQETDSYRDPEGAVVMRMVSQYTQVVAGQSFKLAVDLDIAPGYHLYGQTSGEALVEASRVVIEDGPGFTIGEIAAPSGQVRRDKVLGQDLRIYEGRVRFVVQAKISDDVKPGTIKLVATVSYQACDDQQCLLPKTGTLTQALKVASDQSMISAEWDKVAPESPQP